MNIVELVLGFFGNVGASVLPFILLLGVLIFVHELGHFSVAKYFGVRVEVFSLGFGKKILRRKYGDTEYCISLFPLGGYVKMFGDDPNSEIAESEKSVSYSHKPVIQRMAIVLAGPLMNFFFAVFIFGCIFLIGEDVRKSNLGEVAVNTDAYAAGFRSGDQIVAINGESVATWEDLTKKVEAGAEAELKFSVQRYTPEFLDTKNRTDLVELKLTPKLGPNPNVLSLSDFVGQVDGFNFLHRAPIIGVMDSSIAAKAGLQTGDRVVSLNGIKISLLRDLQFAYEKILGESKANTISLTFEVNRQSEHSSKTESTQTQVIKLDTKPSLVSLQSLGIESSELYLYEVVKGTPAEKAGLVAGDRMVSISGNEIKNWEDLLKSVKAYKNDKEMEIVVLRAGQKNIYKIAPELTTQNTIHGGREKRFTLGVKQWGDFVIPPMVHLKGEGVIDALRHGVQKSVDVSLMTAVSFLRLIQTKISPNQIGGVISIGQAASETFKIGWTQFLQMMGLISINLFVLNLLPVPMLDGGHLVFYCIEALKGAPLSLRKIEIAQQVGLVLLMSLMVFALFNDFSRLLGFQ